MSAVVIDPPDEARCAVIWLHGLGADGYDFEPIVPELGLPATLGVRFVFPHAPRRAVTINQGYVMRAWYDIRDSNLARCEDAEGISESSAYLADVVRQQTDRGILPERIVLAGFSQGGAVALHAGLRLPRRLGGIMALSSYLPLPETLERQAHAANRGTRILMAHGESDTVIPIALGLSSRDRLTTLGYAVEWHAYAMGHTVSLTEIRDAGLWLTSCLGSQDDPQPPLPETH